MKTNLPNKTVTVFLLLLGVFSFQPAKCAGIVNGSIVTIDDVGIMNIHIQNVSIVQVHLVGVTNNCDLTFTGCGQNNCTYVLEGPLPEGLIDVVVTTADSETFPYQNIGVQTERIEITE